MTFFPSSVGIEILEIPPYEYWFLPAHSAACFCRTLCCALPHAVLRTLLHTLLYTLLYTLSHTLPYTLPHTLPHALLRTLLHTLHLLATLLDNANILLLID